ncbi:MAG: glycosyl hydrolase, partial [Actinomycetota bacterium]|nr:glycosyl hydrolase [Actinomycetota bacterium]
SVLRGGEMGAAGDAEPGEWLHDQRAASGPVNHRVYQRALAQAEAVGTLTAEVDPALAEAPWELMGPTNFGGRVTDVAVDPTRATPGAGSVAVAATASGGVWTSRDAGTTWQHAWPKDITQATGAVAVGSDGTWYAGTGESSPGGGSVVWGGTGMYRSRDAGATWEPIGLETSGAFGRVVVDPTNPKRIFAAASGNLFVPGGERGVYRSDDGGDTWERVLEGENETTGAVDVAVDPKDPDNLLATMWDHVRYPTHRIYAGVGSGVWRSTDGGDTWAEVELPQNVAPASVGRIGVAFAASNPAVAYAIVANQANGNAVGVWRSTDGGATWIRRTTAGLSQSSFGWWFGKLWVDPANADRVWVAGVSLVESIDGGGTFTGHAGPHADQHGMAWDPAVDGRVYLGNDGGMYRSDRGGANGTWVPGAGQGWTQHYSVDVSMQNPNQVVTGLQDNGCNRNHVGGNLGNQYIWHTFALCGDGLQTLINYQNDGVTYACSQYGSCSRGTAGGVAAQGIGATTSNRRGWWVPLQFDPTDPNVMYYAGNRLNRSTNGGAAWTAISPDLTRNEPQLDPNAGYRIYHTITTVAAARSDPNVIYVGTDDGLLWRTTDLGGTWSRLSDGDGDDDLPDAWVTRVAVDPADADLAYATFSGFRAGNDTPHVVRTTDGGTTWTDVSGNLPAAPVNDVVVVGGDRLAVATDVGVFLTADGGATWLRAGAGLPAVPVLDLHYHAGINAFTAATFGHGIQRLRLPVPL